MLNVEQIRKDFPILNRLVNGKKLIYFDNAATTQKPRQVINAIKEFYEKYNANIHRSIHTLGEESTKLYEKAHKKVADFIKAKNWREIIFVRNSTEAINLVMYSWAINNLKTGDEIVLTIMEHHSNIVPWQYLQRKGVKLKFVDINENGTLKMGDFEKLVTDKTKLVAVTHVSNVLGTINPVKEIGKIAHDRGALLLVDGAQSIPRMKIDVRDIDADFYVFSGHKMLGPTGIGVLYAKAEILESMEPFLMGGGMIKSVYTDNFTWNELPWKFEAGTPNIAGAVGLSAAIDYINGVGVDNIFRHERRLTEYTLEAIREVENVKIFGPLDTKNRTGVISFNYKGLHPHDVSMFLDQLAGIAIRSGHHCAQLLMRRLGLVATSRASYYIYNTIEEIDIFIKTLKKLREMI